MDLHFDDHEGICIARTNDSELGADRVPELRQKLLACAHENPWCCLDLSRVTCMDSSALGVLVAMFKAVRGRGEFHIFGTQPRIDELLRLTGLKRVFPCHTTEAECLAAMQAERVKAVA